MISSMHFGMTFWLDDDNDFCYCPTFNNNEPDISNWGYVCEWDEITSTDLDKLFAIHRHLVLQTQEDERELTTQEQIDYINSHLTEVN